MQQWRSSVICWNPGQLQAQAERGLNSCSPRRINWKGMKCQACSHRRETVEPPPSHSHPPPTPSNLPQPWPNYFLASRDLPRQTKIWLQPWFSAQTRSLPRLSTPLYRHFEENGPPFFNGPLLGQLRLFTLVRFKCSQIWHPQTTWLPQCVRGSSRARFLFTLPVFLSLFQFHFSSGLDLTHINKKKLKNSNC